MARKSKPKHINSFGHYWDECSACGPMVVCGKCGNNCCTGGYGMLANGRECNACLSAYDMQDKQWSKK